MSIIDVKELPRNYLLAVIDGNDSAAAAVAELQTAGYPDAQVFHGEELPEAVGAQGNFLSRILKSIPEHLSEESNYLAQYQDEALKGAAIVAVKTDGDQAQAVQRILEGFGARNARFFGALTVTDLSVETNPSVREDV